MRGGEGYDGDDAHDEKGGQSRDAFPQLGLDSSWGNVRRSGEFFVADFALEKVICCHTAVSVKGLRMQMLEAERILNMLGKSLGILPERLETT